MAAVADVAVRVDARDANKQLNSLGTASQKAGNAVQKTGRQAATASANIQRFGIAFRSVIAPIVAVTASVNFLGRSLKVLGDRQSDTAALANGLAKVGAEAGTLKELQSVADQLGKQTLFDEEDFTQGFKLLTSFQEIGVASYQRVATAAADLSQVTGADLNSSLLQLSKALQDPVKGLTALSRSGTTFTEQQKTQIKTLVESGNTLQAQEVILKEIEKQYGNAATAAGSAGFAGAMDTLGETFRDFQAAVAEQAEPAVTTFVNALSGVFENLSKVNPEFLEAVGTLGKIAVSLGIVVGAYKTLKTAIAAAAAAKAFLLSLTGIGLAKIALAAGATALVYSKLNESVEETETELKEQKQKVEEVNERTRQTNKLSKSGVDLAKAKTAALKQQAEQLQTAANQAQRGLNKEQAELDNRNKLSDAYYDAELKLNALAIQRARQQGKLGLVLKLEIQRAKIIYNQTISQIKAEVEKARLAARQVLLETKILRAKLLQKKAAGKLTKADVASYNAQLDALKTANKNVEVQKKVAEQQIKGAKATYDASVSAAKFAYQQGKAAKAAKKTADEMQRARKGAGGGAGQRDEYPDEEFGTYEPKGYLDKMFSYDIFGNPVKRYASKYGYTRKPRQMAEGGYVTRPTDAVIGEAGENEYVIPESKMGSAIRRYARGDRGASVVEGGSETSGSSRRSSGAVVNISTGPVMRMNNKNYVTVSDLNNAVGSVVAAMSESGSSSYGGGARLS